MYCKVQISVESHEWTMAAFHNASATWWQHYIQHSFIKMMDMQSQIIKSLTSPVAHRQSRTLPAKFRILLTGNLDYGYTLDYQLLIADHFLSFPFDADRKTADQLSKAFQFSTASVKHLKYFYNCFQTLVTWGHKNTTASWQPWCIITLWSWYARRVSSLSLFRSPNPEKKYLDL